MSKSVHLIFSIRVKAYTKQFFLLFDRVILIKIYRKDLSQNGHLVEILGWNIEPTKS
jgi:hypothetical protein